MKEREENQKLIIFLFFFRCGQDRTLMTELFVRAMTRIPLLLHSNSNCQAKALFYIAHDTDLCYGNCIIV